MTNENNDKGHGRLEQRVAAIANDIAWVEWPGLKAIAQITATVWRKGKETREIRYYISPLALDVVFNEDKACIRNDNAAENMDVLRKWAIAVLVKAKTKPDQSIKSLMRKNSMAIKHRVAAVNKILHA